MRCTEVEVVESNLDLIPYPNPSSEGALHFEYRAKYSASLSLKVYDFRSTLLAQKRILAKKGYQVISIDISFLSQGHYFVELEDGENREVVKFVIE